MVVVFGQETVPVLWTKNCSPVIIACYTCGTDVVVAGRPLAPSARRASVPQRIVSCIAVGMGQGEGGWWDVGCGDVIRCWHGQGVASGCGHAWGRCLVCQRWR